MQHNLPSIKTLTKLTERYTTDSEETPKERAKLIRSILEDLSLKRVERLEKISGILNLHGVEYIPSGRGSKSPAIDYINSGDTYDITLMYVHYRGFRVGTWGDIVERGHYA